MFDIKDSNITIMVKDLDKALAFYQSIGFAIKNRWEDHYAMLSTKGLTIGLHPTIETDLGSSSVSIGLMVDDIKDAKALLLKNDISFDSEDGKSGLYLYFKDVDGTSIYFVEPKWY